MEISENFNLGKVDCNLVTVIKLFPLGTRLVTPETPPLRYTVESEGYKWVSESVWERTLIEISRYFLDKELHSKDENEHRRVA